MEIKQQRMSVSKGHFKLPTASHETEVEIVEMWIRDAENSLGTLAASHALIVPVTDAFSKGRGRKSCISLPALQ